MWTAPTSTVSINRRSAIAAAARLSSWPSVDAKRRRHRDDRQPPEVRAVARPPGVRAHQQRRDDRAAEEQHDAGGQGASRAADRGEREGQQERAAEQRAEAADPHVVEVVEREVAPRHRERPHELPRPWRRTAPCPASRTPRRPAAGPWLRPIMLCGVSYSSIGSRPLPGEARILGRALHRVERVPAVDRVRDVRVEAEDEGPDDQGDDRPAPRSARGGRAGARGSRARRRGRRSTRRRAR